MQTAAVPESKDRSCPGGYRLGLYEKSMPSGMSLRDKLCLTKECGFDYLEISIDETDEKLSRLTWDDDTLNRLRRDSEQTGVPILSMCLSGHRKYPLGSHDSKIREKSLDILARAIRFAAVTGVRIVQLAGYDVYYEQSDEFTKACFFEGLKKAARLAAEYGIILAFETMETSFMDTVGKAMKYVDLVRSPYLGLYPDIGNLKNAACLYDSDVVDDLKTGKGHIFAAHLKETMPGVYRNMLFGTGHTEYLPCLQELLSQGVCLFVGEFWYAEGRDFRQDICRSAQFLRGKIECAGQQIQQNAETIF